MTSPPLRQPSALLDRPERGDGYGQMLIDCHDAGARPGTHRQVIERIDGYVSVEDAYRYFMPPEEWVAAERAALDHAQGRILDVGCAAGRHMVEARERGHEAVGIDPSEGAVTVARRYGLDVRLGTLLEPGKDLGTFDTFFLLGGNLGLLGSREVAPVALGILAGLARPGAQILANGHDPYTVHDQAHAEYHRANREAGRLPGQVQMRVRYGKLASAWFDRLMLSAQELDTLLEGSPWELVSASHYGPTGFYLARMELREEFSASSPTAC